MRASVAMVSATIVVVIGMVVLLVTVVTAPNRGLTSGAVEAAIENSRTTWTQDPQVQELVEWFQRMERLGVRELVEDAERATYSEKDFDKAIKIYNMALSKAGDDPQIALYLRSSIVMCRMLRGDQSDVVAAARQVLRGAPPVEALPLIVAPASMWIVHAVIMWDEDPSHQDLSQAVALAELGVRTASEMVATLAPLAEEGAALGWSVDGRILEIQRKTWRGRILAARGKARLGNAEEAEDTLRRAIEECTHWTTMPLSRHCLGKSLVQWGRPQEAVKLLKEALPLYEVCEQKMSGVVKCPWFDWERADVERMLAEIDPGGVSERYQASLLSHPSATALGM